MPRSSSSRSGGGFSGFRSGKQISNGGQTPKYWWRAAAMSNSDVNSAGYISSGESQRAYVPDRYVCEHRLSWYKEMVDQYGRDDLATRHVLSHLLEGCGKGSEHDLSAAASKIYDSNDRNKNK